MIRLDLTHTPVARLALDTAPAAVIALGAPLARIDVTPRPLGAIALPVFPVELDDTFLQAGAEFLEAGGERLQW
jgi:hypothetical protein